MFLRMNDSVPSNFLRGFVYSASLLAILLSPVILPAQTVCDVGNKALNPAQPSGGTPAEIISEFAAKESAFRAARARYQFSLDLTVQTLAISGQINGEYHQVTENIPHHSGPPIQKVTLAPESSLRMLSLTEDDLDDVRVRLPAAPTTEELPFLVVSYVGRQHVDMLDTYVFDVTPKNKKNEMSLFKGRLWVDDQDHMIVKTCSKPHPDGKEKKGYASRTPLFVAYREEIDHKYWFSTYAKADEFLSFPRGDIHVREIVRYRDYKASGLQ